METCKARKCFRNKDLNHKMKGWNDFKRCDKKVFQDGFCKKCFSKDVRNYIGSKKKPDDGWGGWSVWAQDGIYGEPYDFPRHVTEYAKKWVDKIYDLHPSIKPKKANELTKDHDQMIDNIKQWIEKYSKNISYEMGLELSQIIH